MQERDVGARGRGKEANGRRRGCRRRKSSVVIYSFSFLWRMRAIRTPQFFMLLVIYSPSRTTISLFHCRAFSRLDERNSVRVPILSSACAATLELLNKI
jgi:hypothetical protein